ncbi:MAG TPA: SDR family NAD(P)-dependent oxidoreductase [Streptosporangiaceae bacterium]|jgi:NAD(P)-dependent dehydrogenase (short-subunit alcohol dehydrogenase family)
MDLELGGHRALVTASSGGIGAEIAVRLAAEGAAVLVHGRDEGRTTGVAASLRAEGHDAEAVTGDLTSDTEAARVADRARDWGADILVNNAGPFAERDWSEVTPASWLESMTGNVVSAARLITALLPSLRAGGWGRVINLGSRAATTPLPNMVDYSAAKAAVVNMTTSLSRHLAGTGVTANTVSPGVIVTDGMREMFTARAAAEGNPAPWPEIERAVAEEYAPNPAARLGTATDIAAAVTFLASPLAGYINGIDLRVDGGITGVP